MGQAGPGSLAPDLAPSSVRFMIRERGPDTWQVVVYAGRDRATGREVRVRRTVHGGIRRARQVERDLASEAVAARRREHANVTVSELLARWLEHAEPDLAPSTAHTYRSYIDRVIVPRIGTVPIAELTTADLDRLYSALRRTKRKGKNEQPLAAATIRQVHAILRRALRQAVRWGWLDRNPAAEASPPAQGQTRATAPEPDVVVRLLDAAAAIDADVAVFLRLAVITGARRGELCALRWTDVDLDAGSATIARSLTALPGRGIEEKPTKTGGVRPVALDAATVEHLRLLKGRQLDLCRELGATADPGGHVFTTLPGRPWRPDRATALFRLAAGTAGFSGRLHDLRHFSVTQLLAAGFPVRQVGARVGHASAKMTLDVYGHAIPAADQGLAAALAAALCGSSGA